MRQNGAKEAGCQRAPVGIAFGGLTPPETVIRTAGPRRPRFFVTARLGKRRGEHGSDGARCEVRGV
jgi:hypothetical protein